MRYLYHYTSLNTLALILSNQTICFNNLLNVDDMEEAETNDMGKFGRFVYVSCWTDDSEESIPLWNLYTPNMHGVRIRLPVFPFKKYSYKKGDLFLSEDIGTYIDLQQIYTDNQISIVPKEPHLVKVEYTDDPTKLFPKVKTESFEGAANLFLQARSLSDLRAKNVKVEYSFAELGKYKRSNWAFQREWRYIISTGPMGSKDLHPSTLAKQQEVIRRIEDRSFLPPHQQLYLSIDSEALKDLEVVFGPRMNASEKIMAKALLTKYCPTAEYRESLLRIR